MSTSISSGGPESMQGLIPPPTQVDDSHKNYAFGIACAVMGAVGTLGVLGRLAIRYHCRDFGVDDWAIIPAVILFFAWTTMGSWLCLNVGVGKPLWEITVNEYSMWLNGQLACAWLYPAMSASIRISILLFYRRIFRRDEITNRLIWGLLMLNGVYIIAFSIAPVRLCTDFHTSFFTWTTNCSYEYFKILQTTLYTVSLALDLMIFLFPIYPIAKLQMKNTRRTKTIAIFAFGLAATLVAAWKLGISIKEWVHPIPADSLFWKYEMSLYVPGQYSDYGTTFWIPSMLEPTIAILATSFPAFRQLHQRLKNRSQTKRLYHISRTGTGEFNKNGMPRTGLLNSQSANDRADFINLNSVEIELENQDNAKGKAVWADERSV